jgi:hypothetical protein
MRGVCGQFDLVLFSLNFFKKVEYGNGLPLIFNLFIV